jgi:tRNA (Thr-GGU) A37 N-methylase
MCGIELRKTCSLKGVMVHEASTALLVEPIGYVRCSRADAQDDHWDTETCRIELLHAHGPASVAGLADFSHIEVLYHFHKVAASEVVSGARHPRGNRAWPLTGDHLCRLLRVDGSTLYVAGLDAIDGTPVLDIKPVMSEFLPRGELRQPAWSHELMRDYWDDGANK